MFFIQVNQLIHVIKFLLSVFLKHHYLCKRVFVSSKEYVTVTPKP